VSWLELAGSGSGWVDELVVVVEAGGVVEMVVAVVVVALEEVVVVELVLCRGDRARYPTAATKTRRQETATAASLLIAWRSWEGPGVMGLQTSKECQIDN